MRRIYHSAGATRRRHETMVAADARRPLPPFAWYGLAARWEAVAATAVSAERAQQAQDYRADAISRWRRAVTSSAMVRFAGDGSFKLVSSRDRFGAVIAALRFIAMVPQAYHNQSADMQRTEMHRVATQILVDLGVVA